MIRRTLAAVAVAAALAACGTSTPDAPDATADGGSVVVVTATGTPNPTTDTPSTGTPATTAPAATATTGPSSGERVTRRLRADVWADNWFSLSVNGVVVGEDHEPLTMERSFNSETFTFSATFPLVIALVAKDYIASDSGLEYLGTERQQIGDGGVIAQLVDVDSGRLVVATDGTWRALVTHHAPVDPACERSPAPDRDCSSVRTAEPTGWRDPGFDDRAWSPATVHTAEAVGVKGGYGSVAWLPGARLVWSSDLRLDNTVLLRRVVEAWS